MISFVAGPAAKSAIVIDPDPFSICTEFVPTPNKQHTCKVPSSRKYEGIGPAAENDVPRDLPVVHDRLRPVAAKHCHGSAFDNTVLF